MRVLEVGAQVRNGLRVLDRWSHTSMPKSSPVRIAALKPANSCVNLATKVGRDPIPSCNAGGVQGRSAAPP